MAGGKIAINEGNTVFFIETSLKIYKQLIKNLLLWK